ncbi:MAG: DUF5658 family protein [Phycisphaerales bacterium JB059]
MACAAPNPERSPGVVLNASGAALGLVRRIDPRTRRVVLLLLAIFIMSVGDLLLTLTYLQHLGMAESNPIARLVLDFGSPGLLVAWKMATVVACAAILLWKSTSRAAEIGAWTGTFILGALMLHWSSYVKIAPPVPPIETAGLFAGDERWMTLTPADRISPRRASVPTP